MRELSTQELDLVAGGFTVPTPGGTEVAKITFNEAVTIAKLDTQLVALYGSFASVQSTANAYGYGNQSEVFTATVTTPYSSSASGTSISASNS